MRIISLEKPSLPKVKMNVDNLIDEKLKKYPAIEKCFGTSNTTLISGGPGSGKTTFIIQMLKTIFKKVFHNIYVIIPQNSLQSIDPKDNVFQQYLEPENIYNTYDVETLETIYDKLQEDSSEGHYSLLIVDDFGDKLKQKLEAKMLEKMFLKNRHLRLTSFILCQNFGQMPKNIREITNNCILFNTNKSQNEKFFNQMFNFKKQEFDEVMKLLSTTHDYLLISLKHKKLYYNWDEIVFDDEDEKDKKGKEKK
jgi:hypothetical protein